MNKIKTYIDRIMAVADLAPKDSRRVRGELTDHLLEIVKLGKQNNISYEETLAMIEKEFGDSNELGKAIAKSKGKFRTYLKKQARQLPLAIFVAVIFAFTIKAVAMEAFVVTNDAVAPAISIGQRILVNKLTSDFEENDVIVFENDGTKRIGWVKEVIRPDNVVIVARQGEDDEKVAIDQIIGKAFFLYGPISNTK